MACSRLADPEGGFATPAAVITALAIATLASASLVVSVGELRAARSRLNRTQIAYALEGAQASAVLTLQHAQSRTLAWHIGGPAGPIQMLAEPEGLKVGPGAPLTALSDGELAALSVQDSEQLRNRLHELGKAKAVRAADITSLDPSRAWALCGRTLVSPWGRAVVSSPSRGEEPVIASGATRAGETWRVVGSVGGWTDERTIILTGDPRRPVLSRERLFERRTEGPSTCEDMIGMAQPRATTKATP